MSEVDVELAAARRRISFRHVLANDVDGPRAGDEDRSHVADERLHNIALFVIERVRGADRFAFLPQRSIQTADHFRLTKKRDEALLEKSRELQVVLDIEELFASEAVRFDHW